VQREGRSSRVKVVQARLRHTELWRHHMHHFLTVLTDYMTHQVQGRAAVP
jgi:hypothetical protein